jgi:ribonuclease P protein component
MVEVPGPEAPSPAIQIARLKKRPDFLAVARALNCARGAVVAQARYRGDGADLVRVGFTATKRIGGAVVRNRAKRRLREAARLIAPLHVRRGCDYVFIARGGTVSRPWAPLLDDMKSALIRLAAELGSGLGETPPQRLQTRPDPSP